MAVSATPAATGHRPTAVSNPIGASDVDGRFARLRTTDLINLAVEAPDTPVNVGALAVLDGRDLYGADGKLRLSQIRGEIERRLAGVPQLRRVLHRPGPLAGRPLWTDDPQFRVDRHVDEVEAPPPGDEQSLLRLTARLTTALLDRRHPLWRVWLVTGLPAGRVAVVVVLHHVVADGLAAIHMITSLLSSPGVPAGQAQPAVATVPRWGVLVADNARTRLAAVVRAAHALRPRRLVASARVGRHVLARTTRAPRTSLNAPIGPRRRLAVVRLDLATAKRVAHRHGGTVNDLVLDLAAGGLRALLRARAEPVDGMRLNTTIAVSLRPAGAPAEAGNRTGAMVVRLPLGEPDPAARLSLVAGETTLAKRDQLFGASNALLAGLARLGLARWFSRRQHWTNLVESNVAGPEAPIRMLGAPVLDLVPIGCLIGNMAVSFLALSYAGQLTITVQVDADRFPDLPVLMSAMWQDWTTLAAG